MEDPFTTNLSTTNFWIYKNLELFVGWDPKDGLWVLGWDYVNDTSYDMSVNLVKFLKHRWRETQGYQGYPLKKYHKIFQNH